MSIRLPQKQFMKTVLKFKEDLVCNLSVMLNGLDKDVLSPEHRKIVTLNECSLAMWPPISKVCEECISKNKPERYLEDKKGRRVKVVG